MGAGESVRFDEYVGQLCEVSGHKDCWTSQSGRIRMSAMDDLSTVLKRLRLSAPGDSGPSACTALRNGANEPSSKRMPLQRSRHGVPWRSVCPIRKCHPA